MKKLTIEQRREILGQMAIFEIYTEVLHRFTAIPIWTEVKSKLYTRSYMRLSTHRILVSDEIKNVLSKMMRRATPGFDVYGVISKSLINLEGN